MVNGTGTPKPTGCGPIIASATEAR